MTAWRVGLLMVLVFGGCRSGGNTELLERQLRIQEDRIYQLEDELEHHCDMLTACRKENHALKTVGKPTAVAPGPAATSPRTTPPSVPIPDLTPPKIELDLPPVPSPSSSSSSLPLLNAPITDEPFESARSDESSLRIRIPTSDAPPPPADSSERMVDKSAARVDAPAQGRASEQDAEPSRQARLPSAPRRPKWSPYR